MPSLSERSVRKLSATAAQHRRRFYKQVSVVAATPDCEAHSSPSSSSASVDVESADTSQQRQNQQQQQQLFEVCLDHRRLRTPGGRVLRVPGHPLALAVAHEWASCGEHVRPSSMHVTALCNTALDQPGAAASSPQQQVDKMADMVHGDTLLFPVSRPSTLAAAQQTHWTPLLRWFDRRFHVSLTDSCIADSLLPPTQSGAAAAAVVSHLSQMSTWTLTGLVFATEALRSPLLALAALELRLGVEHVTRLSRLETECQTEVWGRVQWSHDVDALDTQTRVAAGLLLAKLTYNATDHEVKRTSDNSRDNSWSSD